MAEFARQFRTEWMLLGLETEEIANTTAKPAIIFRAHKTGNITKIGFYCSAVTGSPVLSVRLETATNTYSGTLATTSGGGSTLTTITPTTGWNWYTLTAAHSATAGEYLAACIIATTADGSNKFTIWRSVSCIEPTLSSYVIRGSDGTILPRIPLICASYGTELVEGCYPLSGITSTAFGNGATPDEYSVAWTPETDAVVSGVCINIGSGFLRTFDIVLYAGSTSVKTLSCSGTARTSSDSVNRTLFLFDAPYALTAGTLYRIAVKPTSSGDETIVVFTFPASTDRDQVFGSGVLSTRTDAGSWTEDATKAFGITPILSSLGSADGSTVIVIED